MQIGICGAGWLGLPLALHLKNQGHSIVATKRQLVDAELLSSKGITGVPFTIADSLSSKTLSGLFASQVICLNIAPGRKSLDPKQYVSDMCNFIDHAHKCGVKNLIFISTSAVYGEDTRTVYEYSSIAPVTESAKAHIAIERHLNQVYGKDSCILRLSGLVGENRHPARTLAGKKAMENGQRKVNLIHQDDVVRAITAVIDKVTYGLTLHLAAPHHPSRQEYYQAAANILELAPPEFTPVKDANKVGKQINCDLTLETLDISLSYPSPMDMISR